MSERKKSCWLPWCTAILLIVFVAYPLSVGPFVWIAFRIQAANGGVVPGWVLTIAQAYRPLFVVVEACPQRVIDIVTAYNEWWSGAEFD